MSEMVNSATNLSGKVDRFHLMPIVYSVYRLVCLDSLLPINNRLSYDRHNVLKVALTLSLLKVHYSTGL